MARFVVGLRGGIGTGKSAVSNIFESLGVDIADADISSRNVMKPGEEAFKKVVDHFGKDILDSAGEINRPRLRKIVFSKPEEKAFPRKSDCPFNYRGPAQKNSALYLRICDACFIDRKWKNKPYGSALSRGRKKKQPNKKGHGTR